MRRLAPALLALVALPACSVDFDGAACARCRTDAAPPGGDPDAAVDPCADVTCDRPPADGCEDDMVATYVVDGTCDAVTRECVYTPRLTACDQPPPDECADGTLLDYPDVGSCAPAGGDPRCEYEATATDCAAVDRQCQAAACVDPCQVNPCDQPPPARCTGPNLHTFASPGACTSPGGVVGCEYTETTINCAARGQVCDAEAGACVDP